MGSQRLESATIRHWLSFLLSYKGDHRRGPSRDGMLDAVRQAVQQSAAWALQLATSLRTAGHFTTDLWRAMLWGLAQSELDDSQWQELMELMEAHPELLDAYEHAMIQLLRSAVGRAERPLPASCLPLAEAVADRLWEHAVATHAEPREESRDWLSVAINQAGGELALFALEALSRHRRAAGSSWKGLPPEASSRLEQMLGTPGHTANMARIVIASQLHFMHDLDPGWARKHVLPLLSWKNDEARAERTWHGFLKWGRWTHSLLDDLLPLYEECFSRVSKSLSKLGEPLANHVAGICLFTPPSDKKTAWLNHFLTSVSREVRVKFASIVGHTLWVSSEESVAEAWHGWIREYWWNRNLGRPIPLEKEEVSQMASWLPHLGTVLPAGVALLCDWHGDLEVDHSTWHLLRENNAATHAPKATAEFVLYLLQRASPMHLDTDLTYLVESLIPTPDSAPLLRQVVDRMTALGSSDGARLQDRIDDSASDL